MDIVFFLSKKKFTSHWWEEGFGLSEELFFAGKFSKKVRHEVGILINLHLSLHLSGGDVPPDSVVGAVDEDGVSIIFVAGEDA